MVVDGTKTAANAAHEEWDELEQGLMQQFLHSLSEAGETTMEELAERGSVQLWVLRATDRMLSAARKGDVTAQNQVERLRLTLGDTEPEIIENVLKLNERSETPESPEKLAQKLVIDIALGRWAAAVSVDDERLPVMLRPPSEHVRSELVLLVARVIAIAEQQEILNNWLEGPADNEARSTQETPFAAPDYPVYTSQEMDALFCSIADGARGLNWKNNEQAGARVYERRGLAHAVRLQLMDEERAAGMTTKALEKLTISQDADAVFAVLYVSRVLAPPAPLPPNLRAGAWVDADDIIAKIGWKPRSTQERLDMRRRVWNYLRFGARASISGRRTSKYFDHATGQEIDTFIDGPAWAFLKEEKPVQPSLFAEEDVPLRVELVVSREWTALTTSPMLAQYLPMGELLGGITPDQPSGAWARVLGLALSSFWRRQPKAALDGFLKPSRRELLEHYPPKVAPPADILAGRNPKRAIEYWVSALSILTEKQFLEKSGDATRTVEQIVKALPRYNWGEVFLNENVELHPGPAIRPAIESCFHALPPQRPRDLTVPRRRGRPRKNPLPPQRD